MDEKSRDLKRVRYIASQALMFFLKEKSGNLSYRKLEMLFKKPGDQSEEDFQDICSGAFAKYAAGKIRFKDQKLIQKIESNEKFKGAKYLLEHPLWLILENPECSLEALHQYMHLLPPNIQNCLFKPSKGTGIFERCDWSTTAQFSHISKLNNLDALACFLMLIREMELLTKWHAYVKIKWYAHDLFIRLSYFQPLSSLSVELYSIIWKYFLSKHNPITEDLFKAKHKRQYQFLANSFHSPYSIKNLNICHDFVSEILVNVQKLISIGNSKKKRLDILFWVFEHNWFEVHSALREIDSGSGIPLEIKQLIAAYEDSNTKKHIRRRSVFPF